VCTDVGANGGNERGHAAKDAAPQALARELGKEALDEIQPGIWLFSSTLRTRALAGGFR